MFVVIEATLVPTCSVFLPSHQKEFISKFPKLSTLIGARNLDQCSGNKTHITISIQLLI